ncbi:mitochondrial chaperone BCS1 [Mycena crocata]|nr:mitochondrial chaperone BCS1 [Mycena crocata]
MPFTLPNFLGANPLTFLLPSMLGALGPHSSLLSSVRLIFVGYIIEAGRRVFEWISGRFRLRYSITVDFNEGDLAYEWVELFLKEESVWRQSHEFVVCATGSRRQWSVDPSTIKGHAEYVPSYTRPRLCRWKGYCIYTLDMSVLYELVEHARSRYVAVAREHVVVRLADTVGFVILSGSPSAHILSQQEFHGGTPWGTVKHKVKRGLDTIVLPEGVLSSLLVDAREFLEAEEWYLDTGIPHRRGYLLHGPPGTGKTSTIYALAGELELEIFSISLASGFVDDAYLQRAASFVPKNAIFLIEDIDCCFSARNDADGVPRTHPHSPSSSDEEPGSATHRRGPAVTLSGLLNVIDGLGSDDGHLFFATTNHLNRLDPALIRPGRVDMRLPYALATATQIDGLFRRFFPPARFPKPRDPGNSALSRYDAVQHSIDDSSLEKPQGQEEVESGQSYMNELAQQFVDAVPAGTFSVAQLQGFLQGYKTQPAEAARCVKDWVQGELDAARKQTTPTVD